MKIKDLEVGKEYAVKRGSYGRRGALTEHVPGMENFNPFCLAAKVLEVGIERRVGFDYAKGEPKMRSNYVKVLFRGRNDYEKGAYEATIPSSNIVAPIETYKEQSTKYWAAIEKKRKQREATKNKAQKHIDTIIAEIAKSLGRTKVRGRYVGFNGSLSHYSSRSSIEDYLADATVSISYGSLMEIAEKLTGHKVDVPEIAEKK